MLATLFFFCILFSFPFAPQVRAFWYAGMQALQDVNVQIKGVVYVAVDLGVGSEPDIEYVRKTAVARHAVPFRVRANHILATDVSELPGMKFAPYFMEQTNRLRLRTHYGTCTCDDMTLSHTVISS